MDLTLKSNFLRTKGILTYISTSRRGTNASDGLWVVDDDQYADALACLKDPDHRVENPLDESKMKELESVASQDYSEFINRFLVIAILALLGLYWILCKRVG